MGCSEGQEGRGESGCGRNTSVLGAEDARWLLGHGRVPGTGGGSPRLCWGLDPFLRPGAVPWSCSRTEDLGAGPPAEVASGTAVSSVSPGWLGCAGPDGAEGCAGGSGVSLPGDGASTCLSRGREGGCLGGDAGSAVPSPPGAVAVPFP